MASITLSSVTTRISNLLGSDAQLSTAEIQSIAIARYEHLYDGNPWSKRRKDFTLNLFATSANATADTVTTIQDNANVTSAGTPFSSNLDGKYIKIDSELQYYAVSYNSTSSISLEDGNNNAATWAQASSSNLGWTIFQTVYSLPSDCDLVISLAYNYPLEELDGGREQLDRYDPDRISTASHPTHWCYAGVNSSSVRQIEVWPVPSEALTLRGQYMTESPQVAAATVLDVHPAVFTYAVAADCYNMLHSKTGDVSYKDLAMFYEKKYAETKNDIMPYEVSKNSPPTSLKRRHTAFGRGTDYETNRDLDLMHGW